MQPKTLITSSGQELTSYIGSTKVAMYITYTKYLFNRLAN